MSFDFWSGQQDSNLRPEVPKTSALPDCAIPRMDVIGGAASPSRAFAITRPSGEQERQRVWPRQRRERATPNQTHHGQTWSSAKHGVADVVANLQADPGCGPRIDFENAVGRSA